MITFNDAGLWVCIHLNSFNRMKAKLSSPLRASGINESSQIMSDQLNSFMNCSNRPENTTLFQNGNIGSAVSRESLPLTIPNAAETQTFTTLTTSMVQYNIPTLVHRLDIDARIKYLKGYWGNTLLP
jgi:hypothetical protein